MRGPWQPIGLRPPGCQTKWLCHFREDDPLVSINRSVPTTADERRLNQAYGRERARVEEFPERPPIAQVNLTRRSRNQTQAPFLTTDERRWTRIKESGRPTVHTSRCQPILPELQSYMCESVCICGSIPGFSSKIPVAWEALPGICSKCAILRHWDNPIGEAASFCQRIRPASYSPFSPRA
jgi:hypothetical protein